MHTCAHSHVHKQVLHTCTLTMHTDRSKHASSPHVHTWWSLCRRLYQDNKKLSGCHIKARYVDSTSENNKQSNFEAIDTTLSDMKKISVVTQALPTYKTSHLRAFGTIDRSHICPQSFQEGVKRGQRSRYLS